MLLCAWLPPAICLLQLPPAVPSPSTPVWFREITLYCALLTKARCDQTGARRGEKAAVVVSKGIQARNTKLLSRLPSRYLMAWTFSVCKEKKSSRNYFTFCYPFTCFPLFFFFLSLRLSSPFSLSCSLCSVFSVLRWEGIIMEPAFESFWFKQPDNGLLIEATRRQTIGFNAT